MDVGAENWLKGESVHLVDGVVEGARTVECRWVISWGALVAILGGLCVESRRVEAGRDFMAE